MRIRAILADYSATVTIHFNSAVFIVEMSTVLTGAVPLLHCQLFATLPPLGYPHTPEHMPVKEHPPLSNVDSIYTAAWGLYFTAAPNDIARLTT